MNIAVMNLKYIVDWFVNKFYFIYTMLYAFKNLDRHSKIDAIFMTLLGCCYLYMFIEFLTTL